MNKMKRMNMIYRMNRMTRMNSMKNMKKINKMDRMNTKNTMGKMNKTKQCLRMKSQLDCRNVSPPGPVQPVRSRGSGSSLAAVLGQGRCSLLKRKNYIVIYDSRVVFVPHIWSSLSWPSWPSPALS